MTSRPAIRALLAACLLAGGARTSEAADPPPPLGWYSTSGLSFVMAGGNSRASTLGARVEVKHLGARSTFTIGGSAVRADANDPPRRAVGSADAFEVETGPRVPKAAKYNATAAFDRKVTDRLAWQVGAEFDRDRFSGLSSRTLGYAGVNWLLANRKDFVLKTGLAATLAHQGELVDDPATRDTFAGLRASADAERKLGANSSYVGGLAVDQNLQDTGDARVRFANALAVSMSKRLALQVGLLLLYDHQPSLVDLPLFDTEGVPLGLAVAAPAARLDTTFTVSVVVSFAPRAPAP
jgi:putative salt-induced outer membrane protein YdiY